MGDSGGIEIRTPQAMFQPRISPKGQARMAGLKGKILSMYASGMTTRYIQGQVGMFGEKGARDL